MKHSAASLLLPILVGVAGLLFSACQSESDGDRTDEIRPAERIPSQKAQAFYAGNPEIFILANPGDLPDDLEWKDGMEQEPFASPEAVRGGTVTSYMLSWPPTLRRIGPESNHGFRGVLYDGNDLALVDRHPVTRAFHASLAEAWAISEDRQTVYFRLDPRARFTDGVPVTADDYLFTFFFRLSEYIRDPWSNNWFSTRYESITRYDDHTIAIRLPEPKAEPLNWASIGPTPEHFYHDLDHDFVEKYQWKFEPTTGPYRVRSGDVRRGRSITLTRLDDWWADEHRFYRNRYNPDRMRYLVIRDVEIALQRFLQGDLDIFSLNEPDFWYDKTPDAREVQRGFISRYTFYNDRPRPNLGLWINSAKPLLDNRDIRVGIHHAANFDRVIRFLFRGDYRRLNTTADGYHEFTHPELRAREFSIEKAREAFGRAGFTEAGGDGILRDANGTRLSFTLSTRDGPWRHILPILREEARKTGLDLRLEVLDGTSIYQKVMEKNHEINFGGYNIGLPYPRYWEFWHSENANVPQTNNITNFSDPEADALIETYRTTDSLREMIRLAHQIEEIIHEAAVYVPGHYAPFYRIGAWRWIRFPEFFDVPLSGSPFSYGLFWVDQEKKAEVEALRRAGESLEPIEKVFDDWKTAGQASD